MPKCREHKKEDLEQYLRSAYEDEKPCRNHLSAHSYHVNAMLADMEVRFAIMYEVARRLNLSILAVSQKYNLINYSLATHKLAVIHCGRLVNVFIAVDIVVTQVLRQTTPDNPSIILLHVSGSHWVPVIIYQDQNTNQLSVLTINSSLDPILHTSELKNFVKAIVDKASGLGLKITHSDESREVQMANICGLASAHACGIVMTCLQSNLPVRLNLLNEEASRLMTGDNSSEAGREISYCIQGRRTFALLEYLYHNFERVEENINIIERIALVKYGLLTESESRNRLFKVDYFLEKREALRLNESTRIAAKRTSYKQVSKDNYPVAPYKEECKKRKVAINLNISPELELPSANTDQELSNADREEVFLNEIVSSKDPFLVSRYVMKGGNVNASTGWGRTALMIAISARQELYYSQLIGAGAALDVKDIYGNTALGLSMAQQNLPAIKALLLNSVTVSKEHFTLPDQTWVSRVMVSFSIWSPPELSEVDTMLLAYKTDPLKWLKDNGANEKQVAKYHQQNLKPFVHFVERTMFIGAP